MKIEISEQARKDAIASIQRYFEENMPEPIGNLLAGMLLEFFVEEIGPAIYNRAIADWQELMAVRVFGLGGSCIPANFNWPQRCKAQEQAK
jgi:uncharacterized protein (DUF2164 family)